MDPLMQQDQSAAHLQQLALAELDVANRKLAEAGRTIDELRLDALALASRVDDARSEAESFKEQVEQGCAENVDLRGQIAEGVSGQDTLRNTISDLEAHVARLKQQLERPERLVVKKALRRGPYARPDAS